MPVTVTVKDHELVAMRELVDNVRVISRVIAPIAEAEYPVKLINWAQMVEDILTRIETR